MGLVVVAARLIETSSSTSEAIKASPCSLLLLLLSSCLFLERQGETNFYRFMRFTWLSKHSF